MLRTENRPGSRQNVSEFDIQIFRQKMDSYSRRQSLESSQSKTRKRGSESLMEENHATQTYYPNSWYGHTQNTNNKKQKTLVPTTAHNSLDSLPDLALPSPVQSTQHLHLFASTQRRFISPRNSLTNTLSSRHESISPKQTSYNQTASWIDDVDMLFADSSSRSSIDSSSYEPATPPLSATPTSSHHNRYYNPTLTTPPNRGAFDDGFVDLSTLADQDFDCDTTLTMLAAAPPPEQFQKLPPSKQAQQQRDHDIMMMNQDFGFWNTGQHESRNLAPTEYNDIFNSFVNVS